MDALRTAAVLKITIEGDFETGFGLARRCHALARNPAAHQQMHVTWPLLAALYHLGRWEEMFEIVEEHMAAYAREPAVECHFVRDGPLIAASALADMGEMDQARSLAAVPGDPTAHPDTASAWQAWYLVASGDPEAAGCGLVGALGFYHITQAVAARAAPAAPARAIIWLTLFGAFSSPVYLPLTAWLT